MKTSAIEVKDMLSVLSIDEVEKRIGEVPGVMSVTVNFAAANATVRYDETQLEISDIKSAVRQRGFDAASPAGSAANEPHAKHAPPTAPSESAKSAPTSTALEAHTPAPTGSADAATKDTAVPSTKPAALPAKPIAEPPKDAAEKH